MIAELNDLRMVCLLDAVTPGWFTNTVSFRLVIDYNRYCGSFEVLQAKAKCPFLPGSRVRFRVPKTNNTPRAMGRLMYLPCILLRVGR